MIHRTALLIIGLFIFTINLKAKEIKGIVIDSISEAPLEFVNIGIVDMGIGTITNEFGEFNLDIEELPNDCKVQISMIGYETQTLTVHNIIGATPLVKLVKKTFELNEVTIKSKNIIREIGSVKTSKMGRVCGWQGTDTGKGRELGLFLSLGEAPVLIKDLNLKFRKHSFDTLVFRLHIRSIQDELPNEELLNRNIFFTITEYSGWQKIDLSDYNIILSGDVALTVEWIKRSNVIEKRMIKVNGSKQATPIVLFALNEKQGSLLRRRSSAAKWIKSDDFSPGFYITVRE